MSSIVTQFEDVTRSGWRVATKRFTRLRTAITLPLVLLLFLFAVLWPYIVVTVPAGHVAVRWWRLFGGTDISRIYGEGIHFNFPWDKMPIYDVRLQKIGRDFDVLTSDGMMMAVNIAVRFRVNPDTLGLLHKNVGPAYADTLLLPAVGTYARQTFSQYPAADAYGIDRLTIQNRIKQAAADDIAPHTAAGQAPPIPWLFVDDVLISSMRFPPAVENAINRKMEQYQVKKEYEYRLERERLESERKEVEAEGIARFQQIVGAGISPNYLRWKGIDATLALAKSPNTKIVVIGTPQDGLPLILGNAETAGTGTPAAAPQADMRPGDPQK